jgi:hypothetical protein
MRLIIQFIFLTLMGRRQMTGLNYVVGKVGNNKSFMMQGKIEKNKQKQNIKMLQMFLKAFMQVQLRQGNSIIHIN